MVGTGLEESMVAASAARNGHSVLHVDINDYYGGTWAAFTFEGIQKWIESHQQERPTQTCSDNDSNNAVNSKINDELQSFLKDNERLVLYSHDGVGCSITDVNQEWHFTKEKDQDNSLQCNISNTETAQTSDNKPKSYPWTEQKIISSSRHFNLDLVPRLLYAKGAMVELLISSNISRYTEFKVRILC